MLLFKYQYQGESVKSSVISFTKADVLHGIQTTGHAISGLFGFKNQRYNLTASPLGIEYEEYFTKGH